MTPVFKEFIDEFYDLSDFRLTNNYIDRFEKAEQEGCKAIKSLFKEITKEIENFQHDERINAYIELSVICYMKMICYADQYELNKRFYDESRAVTYNNCYNAAVDLLKENDTSEEFDEENCEIFQDMAHVLFKQFTDFFIPSLREKNNSTF